MTSFCRAACLAGFSALVLPAFATRGQLPDESTFRTRAVETVREVLADPEYVGDEGGPGWWERFWRRIFGWLGRLADRVGRLPPVFLWVIVVFLILALLAILAHLVFTIVGLLGPGRSGIGRSGRSAGPAGTVIDLASLDYEAASARARSLLAAERWPAAMRYIHVAAILLLDSAGVVTYRACKTNHEYASDLASHPNLRERFRRLTDGFESVIYGSAPTEEPTAREMAALLEALQSDVQNRVKG